MHAESHHQNFCSSILAGELPLSKFFMAQMSRVFFRKPEKCKNDFFGAPTVVFIKDAKF
jgi:hypothetical protein